MEQHDFNRFFTAMKNLLSVMGRMYRDNDQNKRAMMAWWDALEQLPTCDVLSVLSDYASNAKRMPIPSDIVEGCAILRRARASAWSDASRDFDRKRTKPASKSEIKKMMQEKLDKLDPSDTQSRQFLQYMIDRFIATNRNLL